jgi:hypothetical protein
VVLELSAPGMPDTGTTRESGPDEPRVFGEPCASRGRRLNQALGRKALLRAAEGSQRLRDGEGEEEVRPGQLCVSVVLEPWLGCMLLTRRTGPVTTGMMDAVLLATTLALREAVARVPTVARLAGADDRAGCEGQMGGALQVLWRKGGEEIAQGGHGRSPCMRALRRASASSGPVWGRGKETIGVASGVGPRERWMSRGCTPAASRGVA